jgi:hypothetical protein
MNCTTLRMKRGALGVSFKKTSLSEGEGSEWLRKARCWKRQRTMSAAVNTMKRRVKR